MTDRIESEDAARRPTAIGGPADWAHQLGVSLEAVELYIASEVIDLHVDSFIWTRLFGYDVRKRHGRGLLGGRLYSMIDLPRLHAGGVGGAIWAITTNPFRSGAGRERAFTKNLAQLRSVFESASDQVTLVRNEREYRAARAQQKHAAFVGIQGGNALDHTPDALAQLIDDLVVQVTLLHLNDSVLGDTSAVARREHERGLTRRGCAYVEALNARRIFVDLAHISRRAFFDAAARSDKSQPLIVTHTGVNAVHQHWRNLDDEQLKVIADSGGVIGVVYHGVYLGGGLASGGTIGQVADHLVHIVRTVGADHAALGSDWDGFIIPTRALRSPLEMPRLVQALLDRGLSTETVQKILGENFLRSLALLRPT